MCTALFDKRTVDQPTLVTVISVTYTPTSVTYAQTLVTYAQTLVTYAQTSVTYAQISVAYTRILVTYTQTSLMYAKFGDIVRTHVQRTQLPKAYTQTSLTPYVIIGDVP